MKANSLFYCDDGHGIAKRNQNLDKKIWWIASVWTKKNDEFGQKNMIVTGQKNSQANSRFSINQN